MTRATLTVTTVLSLAVPAGGSAQIDWASPFQMGPGTVGGFGIHLVDPEPGGDLGVLATWRSRSVPGGVGFRGGLGEGFDGDLALFGGVDGSGYLLPRTEDFPLDMTWAAGAGASVGDHFLLSLPVSLVVGRTLDGDGVLFAPYAGPRLSLDARLGRDRPAGADDDKLDLAFSVDLGGDVIFSDDVAVRFGAAVGDHEALSIGVVFPGVL